MIKKLALAASLSALALSGAQAAEITFDEAIDGATFFDFDGDGDMVVDVRFSTDDPLGFNTVGPGANQTYISEPGLEGTTLLDTDLTVQFLGGAVGTLSFGFATIQADTSVTFTVFDDNDNELGATTVLATFDTNGNFPEALASVSFGGLASYATFNFFGPGERYIIDNFNGTFGSTEDRTPDAPVPVPGALALFAPVAAGLWARGKKTR